MFNVKKALAGVLAGVTLISVAACGNGPDPAAGGSSSQPGPTVEQIKKTGKIRIATFGDLPPYGYVKSLTTPNTGSLTKRPPRGAAHLPDVH